MGPERSIADPTCTIARSLEILGPRWNLLILREAHNGITRFADFKRLLGIAPDVLTDRLASLVEAGILEKRGYREPGERERFDYHLTQRGADLKVVLAALQQWGDEYVPSELGPTVLRRQDETDAPIGVAFVDAAGQVVPPEQVRFRPIPGTPADRYGRAAH